MTDKYEFNEENEVRGTFFSYGKPNDSIVGTFIQKNQTPDDFNPGQMRWKYTLKVKNGSFHKLVNKKPTNEVITLEEGSLCIVSGKADVDAGMVNIPYGNVVGIKYIKERPSKKDKKLTVKECRVYNFGPDPDFEKEGVNADEMGL